MSACDIFGPQWRRLCRCTSLFSKPREEDDDDDDVNCHFLSRLVNHGSDFPSKELLTEMVLIGGRWVGVIKCTIFDGKS